MLVGRTHFYIFCENDRALNPNKSVALLFGTPQRLKYLSWLKSVSSIDRPLLDHFIKILVIDPK